MKTAVHERIDADKPLQWTYKKVLDEARLLYGQDSGAIIVDGQLYPDLGSAEIDVRVKVDDNSINYTRYEFTKIDDQKTAIDAYNRPKIDDFSARLLKYVRTLGQSTPEGHDADAQ